MKMNDLAGSLIDQYRFLDAFLNTIVLQQKAIIENDMKGLEETIKTEGALIIHIEQQERQMIGIIDDLVKKYQIDPPSKSLSQFISALKGKNIELGNLEKIQNLLKKLALKIAKVNAQNKILIEQARDFVQDTISSLINLNKNKILDRKI